MRGLWLLVALLSTALVHPAAADLAVRSDFEGGSVKVLGIDQPSGTIRFQPGGRPQRGWPCWWCFHVTGMDPGRTITLELDMTGLPLDPRWAMPDRATFSTDRQTSLRSNIGPYGAARLAQTSSRSFRANTH